MIYVGIVSRLGCRCVSSLNRTSCVLSRHHYAVAFIAIVFGSRAVELSAYQLARRSSSIHIANRVVDTIPGVCNFILRFRSACHANDAVAHTATTHMHTLMRALMLHFPKNTHCVNM